MIPSIGSNFQNLKIFRQSHQTASQWLSPISSTEVKPAGQRWIPPDHRASIWWPIHC